MELFANKESCCGCTACKSVCPENAITMRSDREGFFYPEIDASLCTDCGLCKDVCAFHDKYDVSENLKMPEIYGAKHKNNNILVASSSGGMFTAISDYILSKNGVIYGVALDENLYVRHERAETKKGRDRFVGSKYVQSDLGEIFWEIKKDLSESRYVLFSGTPCQTAGLKSFIGKTNSEKLFLCDLVCHSTPSPLIWKEYIDFAESERGSKIKEFSFRSKIFGWGQNAFVSTFKNGESDYTSVLSQMFGTFFISGFLSRPSCHHCKYTNFKRPSDITIADFWGVQKAMSDFHDEKGVSLVIVNTPKGQVLFEQMKKDIVFRPSNENDCVRPNLKEPTHSASARELFWEDYYTNGFAHIANRYLFNSLNEEIKDGDEIVVFGTGLLGLNAARDLRLQDKILFFIDNDIQKQIAGIQLNERKFEVYSLAKAKELLEKDIVIVLASLNSGKEMQNQLLSQGIHNRVYYAGF